MPQILTEQEAQELCRRVLSHGSADESHVSVQAGIEGNTRFAANQISTSGDAEDTEVTVTARFGRRRASVRFNALDDDRIAERVARVEQLAELAPEDPEQMPLLGPQAYEGSDAFFDTTAELTPAERAVVVQAIVGPAAEAGLVATGFLQRRVRSTALANSNGLFAYHRSTLASYTTTARTTAGDGSGWAGTTHNDWARTTPAGELAERAIGKARQSAGATALDPGAYTVVLEPTAVGNLVRLLGFALNARAADEGRSFFSRRGGGNKIGEPVVNDAVTLSSDPRDPDLLTQPFTDEGAPVGRTVWIENGVLTNLAYSRYWAEHEGRDPLPFSGGLKMTGGDGSVSDLVASVDRGVLVTRFWYIRSVDTRTLLYTGLTRDGTFMIEDGRITTPVKNFRFNESVVAMLNNVVGMGSVVRVVASESGGLGGAVVVPPLVVRDFHFSSVSDAV